MSASLGRGFRSSESASCLDVLVAKTLVGPDEILPGKEILRGIVGSLVGLIRSNSERVHESSENYDSVPPVAELRDR